MRETIFPSRAAGRIEAPPSKSMAHRLLIAAGLAQEPSVVENLSLSQDVEATLRCLKALNAHCTEDKGFQESEPSPEERERAGEKPGPSPEDRKKTCESPESFLKNGKKVNIQGLDLSKEPTGLLDAGESGSTLRFFIPIALISGKETVFTGSEYLFSRPLSVYEKIAEDQGLVFRKERNRLTVQGPLKAGKYVVDGSISSQFISGLLFALPLLKEDSALELLPPVESLPYIYMTIEALSDFGVQVFYEEENHRIRIPGNQHYQGRAVKVEGDYSNAAFLEALNVVGGQVTVTGLRPDSLQGDAVYGAYFKRLQEGRPELDLSDCPDLAPVLFALAAYLHGAVFTGTRRLRMKESDRAACMQEELAKFGIQLRVEENRVVVPDAALHSPEKILEGHQDHRIVMALATLCSVYGGTIHGAEAVRKSFPDYFDRIKALGIEVEENGMDQ